MFLGAVAKKRYWVMDGSGNVRADHSTQPVEHYPPLCAERQRTSSLGPAIIGIKGDKTQSDLNDHRHPTRRCEADIDPASSLSGRQL